MSDENAGSGSRGGVHLAPVPQPEERRQHRRLALLLPATLYYGREEVSCVIDTISPGGAGLICDLALDAGAFVALRIDRYGVFVAEVMWRQDNRLGLRFLDAPERMARMLGLNQGAPAKIAAEPPG